MVLESISHAGLWNFAPLAVRLQLPRSIYYKFSHKKTVRASYGLKKTEQQASELSFSQDVLVEAHTS